MKNEIIINNVLEYFVQMGNSTFLEWFIENDYKIPNYKEIKIDNTIKGKLTFQTEQEALHYKMRWL